MSHAFESFSAAQWKSQLKDEVFDVLKTNRYKQLQRRKAYLVAAKGVLVLAHVDTTDQTVYPLPAIHKVWWSEARSTQLTMLFHTHDNAARASNASDATPIVPTTGMLELSFRSRVEREMFSNALHLCNPSVTFSSDCQSLDNKHNIRWKCNTLNTLGMMYETVVILNCEKLSVSFGEEFNDPVAPVDDVVIDAVQYHNNPKRVDVSYPQTTESVGIKILQSHTDKNKQAKPKLQLISLVFASPFMKERFLGRVRAMQRKFKGFGSDHEEELPLPSGETLNVLTATWNVGEKGPPDLTQLNDWLPAGEHDVYSIGFQECDKKRKWFKALQDHLCGEGARNRLKSRLQAADKMRNMMERTNGYNSQASTNCEYVLLSVQSLWGIHLVTIVRSDLKARITNLSSSTEATGIAHILGNKGGCATGFVIDNTTSLAFVTSHLAARVTRLHTRQENYEEIVNGLHIQGVAHGRHKTNMDFLHSYDHVFWLGDLNYRVDMGNHGTKKEYEKVCKLAKDEEKRYNLLDHDQLRKEMHSKAVMCDFEEGAIDFAPTYRMLKGSDGYSNKKFQNPSYCDRVLWRSLPGSAPQLYQTLYSSAPKLDMSDHRPILATFAMNVREPFIARGPITSDGGSAGPDLVITSITNLKFTIADETANPKAKRAVKFDGYCGPAVVSFMSSIYDDVYCSAPADCINPDAATSWRKGSNEKRGKSDEGLSSMRSSTKSLAPKKNNNPQWKWDNQEVEDMFPLMSDCEWLATQNITAVVRKGAWADAPILGQCEISLSGAFEELVNDEGQNEIEYDDNDEDDFGSDSHTTVGTNRKNTSVTTMLDQDETDEKTSGSYFKSHVLKNGKYIGDLTGKIAMTHISGLTSVEDEAEIAEKLIVLKRTVMGLREKRAERIAVAKEAPVPKKMLLRSATLGREFQEEEKKVEEVEVAAEVVVQAEPPKDAAKDAAKAIEEEEEEEEPCEEPILIRIGGKAKICGDSDKVANESDNEDDESDNEDEEHESAGPEAWMEGDDVVCRTGQRWPSDLFICVVTGANLVTEDFILRKIYDDKDNKVEPFSKVGYLQAHGKDTVCAYCLKQAKKTQNIVIALGFKWHDNHLKCAHTDKQLPIYDTIMVKEKLPYNEDAYLELFHTCPRCEEPVPIKSGVESGVQALNHVWHRGCFNCDSCNDDFVDGKFFSKEDKNDGRGKMPFCEGCYKDKFMPKCLGCNDFVMLDVEPVVEACGGYWHPEHFRCAKTGKVLVGDFMSHDGLPYCPDAYYEAFGERCTKCSEVMKEQIVNVLGQKWHPECFTCTSSGVKIPKNEDGQYVYFAHELMPYCEEEYAKLFGNTCARCDQAILNDEVVALDDHWHKECLTCQSCSKNLYLAKGGKVVQGPEDGMPYCARCYGRKFGDACAACKFPVNPGEIPVKALNKIFHKEHFCCVKCHKGLYGDDDIALEFFPNEGFPFCTECFLEFLCQRCSGCGNPMKPGEDALTLQDGKGANHVYHRDCHKCVITEGTFKETDTIYMNDGFPYCEEAYKEVFADHFCSGCGDGILGARQVALDKSWHPGHIGCASCDVELASNAIFVREEAGKGGGKWPVCKDHMICKFEDLTEKGQKKLSGDKTWTDWFHKQSKARDLNEDFKMSRDSIMKGRSESMSSRTESLRSTLANPFSGFEQNMREAMGIASNKGRVGSEVSSIGDASVMTEPGKTADAWVELKDNQGYTYYWNTLSDETTYDRPEGMKIEMGHDGSTEGGEEKEEEGKIMRDRHGSTWSVHADADGHNYYENVDKGITQWELPADIVEEGEEEEGGATSPPCARTWARHLSDVGKGEIAERASEWSVLTDDFGTEYFENSKTNKTTWEKPIELEVVSELEGLGEETDKEKEEKEEEEEKRREEEEEEEEENKRKEKEEEEKKLKTEEKEKEEKEKQAAPPPPVDATPPPPPPALALKTSSSTPGPPPGKGGLESASDRTSVSKNRTAKEEIHTNQRRPSKLNIIITMDWSQNPMVRDGQKALHKQGYMKKKGGGSGLFGRRNWNDRYFVLTNSTMGYWKTIDDFKANEKPIKGSSFDVTGCVVSIDDSEDARKKYVDMYLFVVKLWNKEEARFEEREHHMLVDSKEEREGWVNVLRMSSENVKTEGLHGL